jgi:hypothetical protein
MGMKKRILISLISISSILTMNAQIFTEKVKVRNLGYYAPSIGDGWGDFSVSDGVYGLGIGVANGGTGAGQVSIWTKGGNQHLLFGSSSYGNSLSIYQGKVKVLNLGYYEPSIGDGWGDFSVSDGTYGLAIGVANGGAGAGQVSIWAKGGNQHLLFGTSSYGNSLSIYQGKVKVLNLGNYAPSIANGWGDFSVSDGTYGLAIGVANGGAGAGQVSIWTKGGNQRLLFGNPTNGTIMELYNGNVAVSGKLEAKEIRVTLTPTADFVFEETYKLMPLKDLETYVKAKKHLPEVASATEMKEQGVSLNEMNIKLLQKIEELTLYTIEQNKKLEMQNQRILALENDVKK